MYNILSALFATSEQKIVNFLAANSGEEFTEKAISKATGVKKSAVNLALRRIIKLKIIERKKIGRNSLNKIAENNVIAKEIKVLQNILILFPLLEKLKTESQKIILFGSSAEGKNEKKSDFDLFIQTNSPAKVNKIILSSPLREKLQPVVKKPKDMLKINKNKPLLFQEIERGRVLWEKYEE